MNISFNTLEQFPLPAGYMIKLKSFIISSVFHIEVINVNIYFSRFICTFLHSNYKIFIRSEAPVNVSRACMPIPAGYVCVVRSGTAQDQAYHLPPNVCHGPKTSGSWRRTLKLFLGLRLYPKSGAYPLLGVTTILIGNFWGPLKQTNKHSIKGQSQVYQGVFY